MYGKGKARRCKVHVGRKKKNATRSGKTCSSIQTVSVSHKRNRTYGKQHYTSQSTTVSILWYSLCTIVFLGWKHPINILFNFYIWFNVHRIAASNRERPDQSLWRYLGCESTPGHVCYRELGLRCTGFKTCALVRFTISWPPRCMCSPEYVITRVPCTGKRCNRHVTI